jgi:hypothetical protein
MTFVKQFAKRIPVTAPVYGLPLTTNSLLDCHPRTPHRLLLCLSSLAKRGVDSSADAATFANR